jgi:DNA-nicking Smr family endonuclease
LASVHLHLSAQQMVMKALDQFLAQAAPHIRGGDCACIEGGCGTSGSGKGRK